MNGSTIRVSGPSVGYDREFESLLQRLVSEAGSAIDFDRGSREYIAWVQRALNAAMELRLDVDGLIGPATRSAVRSFQQRNGLAIDGIVGPDTEQRLHQVTGTSPQTGGSAATCPPKPVLVDCPNPGTPVAILDEFDIDDWNLKSSRHLPILNSFADQVVASRTTSRACRTILIAGHTDASGTDDHNFRLGWMRAETVMRALCPILNVKSPGITSGITFQLTSCGERQLKSTAGASRRVEIFCVTSGSGP